MVRACKRERERSPVATETVREWRGRREKEKNRPRPKMIKQMCARMLAEGVINQQDAIDKLMRREPRPGTQTSYGRENRERRRRNWGMAVSLRKRLLRPSVAYVVPVKRTQGAREAIEVLSDDLSSSRTVFAKTFLLTRVKTIRKLFPQLAHTYEHSGRSLLLQQLWEGGLDARNRICFCKQPNGAYTVVTRVKADAITRNRIY